MASGRAGFGPGNRAGQPGRTDGFGPGGLWAERANHLFNWRLGPVSQLWFNRYSNRWFNRPYSRSKVRSFHPVVQPSLQPKQSLVFQPVVHSSLQPKQSSVFQPLLQQHPNRRKVRSFNRSFNSPSTDAKSGPSTGPSTALQPTQSSVLQPLLQPTLPKVMPMHLNRSRRQCNEIPEEQHRQSSKIYVKLHIFIRKAKLSTT